MSEQINSGQVEEQQEQQSGLLLSVEPLQQQGGMKLSAGDDNADTGGSGVKDTGDDAGGGDSSDADGSDTKGSDTDLTDTLGAGTDGSDDASDTDGSDGSGSDGADHSDDASITIDSKDS